MTDLMRRLSRSMVPIVAALLVVAGWWTTTIVFGIAEYWLPAPDDIVRAVTEMPQDYMIDNARVTAVEVAIGFGIAAAAGFLLAILIATSNLLERALLPLLVAFNSIPKVALAPLLLAWLGFGPKPKIVLVVVICFFPILLSSIAGLASTPADLGELARSLTASWWQTFLKIRMPYALPQVFVGLKTASSLAVIGAVVAEMTNPDEGLGSVIMISSTGGNTSLAFAAIVALGLLSVGAFYVLAGAERLLLPWAREISG